ncbi:MAG: cell division protein FtsZ [Proteobacteria bacterium]|nr:cell division protein FtsZ [Pseudomonadota bacterium]
MTINLSVPLSAPQELRPRITVIGVGGAGGNAVNNMIDSHLEGVEFVVANTDAQALIQSRAERRIQMGVSITHGLGAGSRPEVGRAAAEEVLEEIAQHIQASHMVFITAGMGGGTGTGAAPVIAQLAREHGVLTVGVITKPFQFEGAHRMRVAEAGIRELQQYVDTLIIIPNQNLFRVANEKTTFADAFKMADDVLYMGVRGVTDLMVMPGLVNLDFADIRSVMSEMGKAMMGTGEAEGESRAKSAAEAAISNPLLEDTSMKGARGVLINVCGGPDMTLFEVDEAANRIREEVDAEANIIFGSSIDDSMQGRMRVSVVATGIEAEAQAAPRPRLVSVVSPESLPEIEEDEQGEEAKIGVPCYSAAEYAAIAGSGRAGPARPAALGTLPSPAFAKAPAGQPAAPVRPAAVPAEAAKPAVEPEAAATEAAPRPREAFIPPRPQEPAGRTEPAAPEPFAAAAMVNGAAEPARPREKPRMPSLFERVTGAGRARAQAEAAKLEPRIATLAEPPARAAADKPAQGKLGEGDPGARAVQRHEEEEDVLDIPAFLRRQAN